MTYYIAFEGRAIVALHYNGHMYESGYILSIQKGLYRQPYCNRTLSYINKIGFVNEVKL